MVVYYVYIREIEMKRLIFVIVALLGMLFASPLFAATPMEDRSELTVPFQSDGTIEIHNNTGPVTVQTWDKPEVKISYRKWVRFDSSSQAKNLLEAAKAETNVFGNNLKITNYIPPSKKEYGNGRVMFDYKLWVPKSSNLFVKTGAGKIEIHDLNGKCEAKSKKGNIFLKNIQGPVNAHTEYGYVNAKMIKGNTELATTKGDIKCEEIDGALSVHTHDGTVRLSHIKGDSLRSTSKSGDQHLAFVETEKTPMIETDSGDVRISAFKSPAAVKTDSGSITVVSLNSNGTGESRLKSVSGPVEIRDMRGDTVIETSRADTDITLLKGDMKFNSDHGNLDIANLYGTIDAKSNSGTIDVKAKTKDFDKPLRLETASGDIYLSIPTKTPANVMLRTDKGAIKTKFPIKPERGVASYEVEGQINGGGVKVELQSQSGDLELNSL